MSELLLEIMSEEIPARMQARACDNLKRLVGDGLAAAGLAFERASAFATPRRLVLVIEGLPARAPDVSEERRGPRADAPDKAIEGFLKSTGLTREQLETRETEKGAFLFARIDRKGRDVRAAVGDVVLAVLDDFPWPKSMRWANTAVTWVRPVHGILCLVDGEPIERSWNLGTRTGADGESALAIAWGNQTRGHRFMAPEAFKVTGLADYRRALRNAYVILDPDTRRRTIREGAAKLAEDAGLVLKDDPALLDEVAGLVEWPVPLMGTIDDAFMDIPPEVMTATMRKNQKYFALENPDGSLASRFVVVADRETQDHGAAIVAGNERVLRARLSDAKFFWDQDRKQTLAARAPALKEIVFHAKLGTLDEKVDRVEALAAEVATHVPGAAKDKARTAARLAKADLVTGMVGEFPEVQGVMGRYYALNDGEDAEVADAIRDHYAPQGPNDICPTAPVSVTVALADKVDTLVGFWAIDEKPTGSRDPFALRRAALGVIRLVLENGLRLSLREMFSRAAEIQKQSGHFVYTVGRDAIGETPVGELRSPPGYLDDLLAFFADRLKVHLRGQGVRHDLITAVFALPGQDDLVDIMARVAALAEFVATDDGDNLLVAYTRAANILRIEEKRDGVSYDGAVEESALMAAEEHDLNTQLTHLSAALAPILADEQYGEAMGRLAELRAPVDAFFDTVTVNCDDAALRVNRLRLLSRIRATMNQVADFSQIEGGER